MNLRKTNFIKRKKPKKKNSFKPTKRKLKIDFKEKVFAGRFKYRLLIDIQSTLSALKQSLTAYLPVLNSAINFKKFIKSQGNNKEQKYIAHCEETIKQSLKDELKPDLPVTILIGPEGDFSSTEINLAQEVGFTPVSLGQSRLRTETAAIVACHSVAFVNE